MENNNTTSQPEQNKDSEPTKREESVLSNDQLENITGGTAVPVHKLEDIDNQTIDRPIDVETT